MENHLVYSYSHVNICENNKQWNLFHMLFTNILKSYIFNIYICKLNKCISCVNAKRPWGCLFCVKMIHMSK